MRAIRLPAMAIVTNAGGEGSVVIHKLLAEKKTSQGYDAASDKFVDMFKAGTRVHRTSLLFQCDSACHSAFLVSVVVLHLLVDSYVLF